MIRFKVYKGKKVIEEVFYSDDFLRGFKSLNEVKDYIKKSLINHDNYPTDIQLKVSK